jgi:hypothetical protein
MVAATLGHNAVQRSIFFGAWFFLQCGVTHGLFILSSVWMQLCTVAIQPWL